MHEGEHIVTVDCLLHGCFLKNELRFLESYFTPAPLQQELIQDKDGAKFLMISGSHGLLYFKDGELHINTLLRTSKSDNLITVQSLHVYFEEDSF